MKISILAVMAATLVCLAAPAAQAACTPEQIQQKAVLLSVQLQALAQKDAARIQQINQEFTQKSAELQQTGSGADSDAICKYYDEMIEKTK